MRILFYLYPGLLSQGPDFSAGWSLLMLRIMRGAVAQARAECLMVTALRFRALLDPQAEGLAVRYLDDLALHRCIREIDPRSAIPTELSRQARSGEGGPAAAVLAQWLRNACEDFEPEVVVTFSLQAPYVRSIWPGACVLHVEAGAFARAPYPYSLFFDHRGMYGESVAARVPGSAIEASEAALALLGEFRAHAASELARTDPFAAYDFRARHERLALLPLQVSNFYSFDEQSPYRTQFEFLCDVLSCAPPDVGVIVTEYIQWGEVLRSGGSAANLAWLTRTFPNLVFHEAFRKFASPSQYLLAHVDGALTISSNLGCQALLLGKRLWAGAGSYLGNVAHDLELKAFFARLGTPAADRARFLAWYLERYAVPESLFTDGAWFVRYLARRREAIAGATRPEEGFVAIDSPEALRRAWLVPAATAAQRFETPAQRGVRRAVVADIELARAQAWAGARAAAEAGEGEGYVLLNDTRALEGHLHPGSNAGNGYIERRMARAGLERLACANDAGQCRALLAEPQLLRRVRLVVLNAAGSGGGGAMRLRELMAFCGAMRERGVAAVLLNGTWGSEEAALAPLLDAFALVGVRESASLEAIRARRPDARLVPDIAFAAFREPREAHAPPAPPSERRDALALTDHADASVAATLGEFAEHQGLPFYLVGAAHVAALAQAEGAGYALGELAYPRILRGPAELRLADACLTGRFHGLAAALCAGVRALALPAGKRALHALAADAGLGGQAVLGDDWLRLGRHRQRDEIERRLAGWDAAADRSAADYAAAAQDAIERLFDDIARLRSQAPARRASR